MRWLSIILISILALSLVGVAEAAFSFIDPVSGGVMRTATYHMNISSGGAYKNMSNCSLSFTSVASGQTYTKTSKQYNDQKNPGKKNSWVNDTLSTMTWEDANDYAISAVCFNKSRANARTDNTTVTLTGVIVDNFKPGTVSGLSPATATIDKDGNVDFSATVNGVNVTQCSLIFDSKSGPEPSVARTMKHSGNTCTASVNIPASKSGYYWGVRASDGRNTSDSTYNEIIVSTSGNTAKKALVIQQQQAAQQGSGNSTVVWLVLIGLVVYMFKTGKLGK